MAVKFHELEGFFNHIRNGPAFKSRETEEALKNV
jgi:hypothetical protein